MNGESQGVKVFAAIGARQHRRGTGGEGELPAVKPEI